MENKSNSLSRVKRHQREKVLRFSIRKYSFGAASVAVAALMFLGARVASADSVIENNSQPTTDVVKKKEKDKPLAEIQQSTDIKVEVAQNPSEKKTTTNNKNVVKAIDKAKLKKVVEELKTTLSSKSDLDKLVISPIKDRVQKGQALLDSDTATQKDVDELLSLLESDLTVLSNATKESSKVQEATTENKTEIKDNKITSELSEADKTISDKKESLKLSADQLQAAVLELPEHESTKEVFEKANELLGLAQGVLENTTISLNDVEDMTKRVKRMFNSVKNATTRLTSGARDSRNGQSMGQGTQFRATTTEDGRVEGALTNVKEYISEARGQGSTTIGSRDRTISKTFMTAKYSEENGSKFITYDVYFQNDGRALDGATRNALWFYPPRDILYSDGSYPKGPVYEAYYERYRNNTGTGTLSHNPNNFTKVGGTYNVPLRNGQYEDSGSQRLWGESYSYFQMTAGPTRDNQRQEMLKHLKDNPELNSIIKQNNSYPGASYSHLLSIGANVNYAYKYHVKLRLKNNVTADEAKRAGVMAVTTKSGLASNATAAYVYAATGSRLVSKPDAQVYPIQGSTHTKVVGDTIPNSGNPVADRYITRKGSGEFPGGMSWSWEGNNSPSTANAGKFTYTAIARYQDGTTSKDANSGSDGRVYFTVNPKKPTITTSVVNKKGLTNQTIEVNVGSGVKNGSVVKLYDGDRVIGQGTSNGTTARITVSGALPGNPLKAETTVDNGGVVVSQKSDPVTPTEAPDTQAPTLAITPANQTVVEGQTVTFTVTAIDDKHVNLDANEFLTKYGTRVFSGKASITSPTDTDTEKTRRITITTTAEDVGKTNTITFNATDNANHRATPVTFTFTVTSRDTIAPTITAGDATVTSREQITPISVTAVDNTGGVGMRDNNPIEVTGLPAGLTYANNRITGTPTGAPGNSTVTIKAYDKNGNMATKTITITVRSQADTHNPTGAGLTVNQNHTITDAELKAKVSNYAPGTLSIVSRPSTATAGNAGNAVVKVTYPDGTFDNVNVPVTVTDVTGPTITAESATVTKNESITPIPVTAVDNTGGVGMRDNNPIEVTNLPAGLRYANNQITGTPTAGVGYYTVTIKAYDKNNRSTTKQIRITVRSQADAHNPTGTGLTVNQNHTITDAELKAKVSNAGPGTLSIVSRPSTANAGNAGNAVVKVTYPDGTFDNVNVPVTVTDVTGPTITAESATVTKNESITPIPVTAVDNTGGVGIRDNNPIEVTNLPAGLRYANNQITGTPTAGVGYYTVTIKAYDKNNRSTTKQIRITVQDQASKYNPTGETLTVPYNHNITDDEVKAKVQNFAPGTLTVQSKPSTNTSGNVGNAVVKVTYPDGSHDTVNVPVVVGRPNKDDYTPKYNDGSGKPGASVDIPVSEANGKTIPAGTTYTSKTPGVVTVDDKGKVTVTIPADKNPGDEVTGKVLVRYPDGSEEEVPVKVTVTPPEKLTPTIELKPDPKTGDVTVTPKKPDGSTYPSGSKVVIPGENNTPIEVTIGDNGSGEVPNDKLPKKDVPGKGTVTEPNKKPSQPVDVTTPAQKTPTVDVEQDPKTGDVTVTPKKPDGSTFPPGTKVEIPGKDGKPIPVTIGEDGKGKVPNSDLPEGKVPGTGKITEPGKPAVEVPVTTPGKVTPATPTTETPSEIEITRKPNGDAVVTPKKPDGSTYPSGSKVVIPGENNTPIEVTIGDNGSGEVPNDNLPKTDIPGTGTVTEPNKKPSQPVDVTTPARKTPTLDVEQDPKTGDVTVTPKKPDGSTYPPGTKVEIPGKDGNPITVTIGEDGKGKVPNSELPDGKVPGTGKIIEPGKPAVEVPVETPAKVTPETPVTEKPGKIEITQQPNGNAIVTPKKPDGSTYPPGTKVEIPGEDGNTITVTIGDDGSGEVPNDNLPKTDIPGTGTVTEPNKKPSQPVDVTTPARKTPTVDVEQDPKTGDVTVTPKKPDGSTFPPGTKVEIPGKDGKPIPVTIGEDGKGKVPNSDLPEGKVPGTGKITEPGKPAVEVPVTTPGKVTPATPTTETPSEIEITRKPNGDAVVTPKKPDGSTYPSGSKVVIPGENNTPIEVTIGDNGSGEVPNDKLPKKDVPGKGTVTEPNKKPSQPVDVTTPAQKTPTVDVEQDPKTGDVTVTPKKPDGSTFPPGTKVEIPGKDGKPIPVTIGEDGKGKVPNSDLPEGKVPGTGKITEPGKPAVEVPVTTPGKVTPATPTTETPSEIEITRKPNGDAVVTPKKPDGSTYPSGSKVVIPGENNTPIEVTIGDNGSGEVPNDKLPKKDVPGKGTVTEPNKKPSQPVDVTTPAQKTPTVDVEQDPKTGDVTVTPKKPDGSTFPPGTKVEIPGKDGKPIPVTIGEDGKGKVPNSDLPEGKVPGTGKITEPGKPAVEVPVTTPGKVTPATPTTETPSEIEITRKPNGDAVVTPKKPDGSTYPSGSKVVIPGENNTPIEVTIGDNGSGEVPNDKLPKKDVPGKGTVTEPNKKPSQPVDVTTPAQKTPTVDVEQDPKTGDVTVTPKKPDGSTFPPGTKVEIPGKDGKPIPVTIGEDGKGKVPNSDLPEGKVPGTGKITEPGKPAVEVPVTTPGKVTPATPTTETPSEIEITRKPNGDAVVTPKKPDGSTYPPKTTVEIPGEDGNTITVTIGDNGSGEVPNDKLPKKDVPGKGTVTEPNKKPSQPVDVTTPAQKTPTVDVEQDPKTGDVTVTPKKPDGSTFPPGTKVEIPGKDGKPIPVTIGEDGKGKVPNSDLPEGKVPGTGKITEPGKPAVEVPVTTPGKVTPATPTTETPSEIEITRKPNGDAVVTPKKPDGSTYPSGSKVVIPGENNTPIEVTIGDNGSGEVPNDNLPKTDIPGTGTVTEPNKKPSQPVDVTTPARKTPTLDVEQDPKTGDVTVTPKKPDGSTYPPGTKVEIPGKDGNPITVTIGEDGKGKVPNSELPDGKVPGTGKIIEPGKPAVEVPVETPAKVTPETPVTEKPGKIEITQQPNGNAIVTPKKPDGSTYPPGTKVEIPGEDGNTITVTIGDDGSGEVPNDNLPKTDIPGTGTVTEPNKKPSQPVDVTTPARKTPTVDVEQDPKTGDVTVTPKKPDGSTFPPGTKVEIPGKDGKPIPVTIGEDGKGKVPNSDLPEGKVPGTGKITEPGKPAVEVPVTTPGKVTPATPTTETPSEIEITRKPNGDAVVTPKKPDGSTYPSGSKVVIPGENNTPIEVTIGDNGSGEVPNDKLPKKDVPGKGTVTEPNKKPSQPVDVTTPAQKTPTVDVEQDPKTGDVTVTPKKPDGSTFPPGTKVEIPGKDGKPIPVTIGEDGKGKVPNSDLPEGKVPGTGKITEPGKPAVEVPVTTPGKVTPATPTTETPSEIEITRKPNGDAVVTPKKPDGSTYPSGSKVVIPGENNTPIEVTIGDNGSGEVPNDKLPKKDVPGKGTVTEPNKKPSQPVDVTTPAQKTPTVDVEQDPKTGDVTVTPKKPDGSTFPPGTKVEIPGKDGKPIPVTIGEDGKGKVPNSDLPEGKVPGTGKITEPGKPAVEVPVTTPGKVTPATPTTETPSEIEITRKPNGDAVVTPKKPDGSTYPSGSKVVIPGENNTPIEVTIGDNGSGEVPNDKLPKKDVPGKGTVTEPNKKPSQPVDVTTPAQKTPTVDVEQDPKTGDVTVTPKKPDGSTFPPGTKVEIPGKDGKPIPVTIGEDGKGKVPNSDLPEGKVPGTGKITEPGKPAVEVPVTTPGKVTPATPTTETPSEIEITRKPNGDAVVTPKKPDGSTYPPKTTVEIPGEDGNTITVTIGDNGSGEVPNDKLPKKDVPGKGTVTEPNKKPSQPVDVTTPAQKTPTVDVEQDPKTGDVTVTPKKPDGSTFPPGTKVEIPGKDGKPIPVTIGEDGKGKVPNSDLPEGKVPGTGKITEPGKPAVEVPVTTPGKVTPATPTTETPSEIEITRKPNGDAVVTPKKPDGSTYPSGSKVVIPGENNTPIEVTIGDNGSGEVPNDNLPKTDIPGTGTVTEPNKKPSQPVDVTTPARKTPTLDVEQDPKTGDVTVTPKKPDGSTYPPGTKVEIPGKDGNPITVTIGEDGKGKVPNSELPDGKVPGTGKIIEPGKPAVEVPVETPAKVTPETPVTEKPGKIEITQQPNGNAIVTPKKPDGSTYPPGTKVEIPGEDGNTITVTIGDDGSGEVPNDNLPKTDIPGTGTVTEPNKKPSQPVDVTTPARKTPTVDVEQDPKTGDVTVTPKKPDGSTFPPGTKVEIPGKDGKPIPVTIGEDGKGKVPNSDLPEGKVPGTGKITEPGKPAVEVPVTTPGKVTPATPTTETPSEIEITRKPNGDAVVTPKKPDGSTYPSGSKVVIPGENNTPIEVTIGDNGSGEVPNDKLPKKDVPGKGTVTEPNKKPSQPVDVTTPAQKTPTVDVEQDPKTGDVTVTPKKPDGSTFPPGTKVEIPGKDGKPIPVTIGEDGKGKVPNSDLPEGKVPGTGTVTEPNKKPSQPVDVTTPARKTPTLDVEQDPKTGDVTVTPKKPDGSTYPPGTKVEIPGKDGNPITVTIGEDGKGKVPNSELPDGKVPGTGKIIEPGKPAVEVPVETPAKVTPETPVTEKPGKIEITQQPNGNAIVTPKKPDGSTYPPGTKVEIPGEDGNTITVTIGDNGSGEVPNDNLPKKDVPGTGTVTEPNKKPSQPVDVTTPARKTPTLDVEQDPKTGDVTVTPKKPDGSTYPPGTKVEIPGKDGNPITVTIGEDGKGKVPNSELPDGKVPGTGKITEPGKPSVEVPVETPAKVTPETPVTEKPGKIEITQQPNGNAIVTPKKPDGSTYPPGTKVEIPGEDGNTITVTIGDNGSGEVPNDNLPKKDVPGTGRVTEPNKKPSQPVDVTTPARKTPTVDVEQDPKTGDVTVTPKKPDGSTYPPGTKVEIPGKDGNPITVTIGEDGKGKVPNSELPDGKVPGTGKITEPGKPSVEVPVETPAKVTPTTPIPNVDQVDTKNTNDNGAKSNDSQNVLPNTGTESNATLASLGLLGMLGGLGLALGKKKED